MSDAKILNEIPISMNELREELVKIKNRDNELNFRAGKTEEYLQQSSVIKNEKELVDKLIKLNIPRLKDQHIKKIIDILPKTVEELKTVLQGYPISINNENLKKIADMLNKNVE
ncbi:MAG: hypothetical protein ABIC04_00270 [Nanoarchaeota archaeon]